MRSGYCSEIIGNFDKMAATREASVFYTFQKSYLLEVLYKQKQEAKFCDVIMKVCGVEIYAHSNVLAGASPYFNSFLSQDLPRQFSQRSPQVIEIQIDGSDDSGELYERAVSTVVDFIYTGQMLLSSVYAAQVYEIAKIMQIDALVKYCELWLQEKTPDVSIFGIKETGSQTDNQVSPCNLLAETSEKRTINKKDAESDRSRAPNNDLQELNVKPTKPTQLILSQDEIKTNIEACVSELQPKRKRGRPPKSKSPEQFSPVKNFNKKNLREDKEEKLTKEPGSKCIEPESKCVSSPIYKTTTGGSVRRSSRSFKPTPKAKSLNMDKLLKIKSEDCDDEMVKEVSNNDTCTHLKNTEQPVFENNNADNRPKVSVAPEPKDENTSEMVDKSGDVPASKQLVHPENQKQIDRETVGREINSEVIQENHMPLKELMQETLSSIIKQDDTDIQKVVKLEPMANEEEAGRDRESLAYKCDHCIYATDNVYRFRRHMLRHGKARFQCDQCPFKTAMIREYKNHMKIHLLEKNICHYCDSKFDAKEELNEHLLKHKGPKPYFCKLCGWRFKLHAQLMLHLPKHSDDKPFKCKQCPAAFKWKHALKNHAVLHTGKKEHLCDICGYATAHKGQLKGHRLIHTGETLHCPMPGCKFQATKSQNLKYHMLTHTKEKPHQCEVCGQAFSLAKNMRRHRLLHSQVRDIHCELCSFQTTRLDKLKEHKYKDHQIGEPPAKKLKIADMVASNFGLNKREPRVQETMEESSAVPIPKKEVLLLSSAPLSGTDTESQSYKLNLEKGLEDLAGSILIKEEETVSQAILIDPSGAVTQETQPVIEEPGSPFNLEAFGRVVISEEGTHLGYIDKDGNFLPLAAPVDITQATDLEVTDNIETIETAIVEQQVDEGEGQVGPDEQVQYTELVIPADQMQDLVGQVSSVETS